MNRFGQSALALGTAPAHPRAMVDTIFDTLKAAKALQSAGVETRHAEAIVATIGDAINSNIATKTDLARLETRIVLAVVAVGGSVVALLKLLP